MLLAIEPLAAVATPIRPDEFAVSSLLVFGIFTDVLPAISPGEGSFAMHFISYPFTLIFPKI
jgi:hypothetical protein